MAGVKHSKEKYSDMITPSSVIMDDFSAGVDSCKHHQLDRMSERPNLFVTFAFANE